MEDTDGFSIHFGLGDHKQVAATGCLWFPENGQQRIRAQVDVWAWVMTKCQIFLWTLGAAKAACVDICDSCYYKVPCQSRWSAQLCGTMVTSGFGCCCLPCLGSWSCHSQGLYWCPWPGPCWCQGSGLQSVAMLVSTLARPLWVISAVKWGHGLILTRAAAKCCDPATTRVLVDVYSYWDHLRLCQCWGSEPPLGPKLMWEGQLLQVPCWSKWPTMPHGDRGLGPCLDLWSHL